MNKINPSLWFDSNAEEAANFYISVFKNSKIINIARYGPNTPGPEGKVMTVSFLLDGNESLAINGGPVFSFTPAISFIVNCEDQDEVDYYWEKLSSGGEKGQCGWLTDKHGISWQIVPTALNEMMSSKDSTKTNAMIQCMLKMTKLNISELKDAFDNAQ